MLLSLISVTVTLWVSRAHGQETTCDPPTIANGLYAPKETKYRLEDVITYHCDSGFYPSSRGNKTRCTEGGWAPPPRCSRKCVVSNFEHGHSPRYGKTYLQGETANVLCHPGYSHESRQSTVTCMEHGWSSSLSCLKKEPAALTFECGVDLGTLL
ncbi:complement factor H-related protein 3-like [Sturnira hondurensis]|uniref:complement factor H-related protein 3-like n=1 Tax=Sturnira hondurensis TaxID=192404 RepID=UPI001879A5CD|nr:complement factor H-related protein 3-like [Sturnira hondurensis]